jgi:SAM-dependent methyltransferase
VAVNEAADPPMEPRRPSWHFVPGHADHLSAGQIAAHDRQRELGADAERQLIKLLGSVFPPGSVVADVGGGTGVAAPLLAAAGLRGVLLDISSSMLAVAASRGVPCVQADLCGAPIATRSVDGIYAAYVIQNIPAWRRALAELARVVKPDGVVLIALGGPPVDDLSCELSLRYFEALRERGADRVGVAAEASGLRDADDVITVLHDHGLDLAAIHHVDGQQRRSIRDIVDQRAANPFAVRAPGHVVEAARDQTLAWAASRFGDPDLARTFRVRHTLHDFRPASRG